MFNGTFDRAIWKTAVKPRIGISSCPYKGPRLCFCPCLIPQGMSHSCSKNTEPYSWTLLAINCCETAWFLIKPSTSLMREVKMRSANENPWGSRWGVGPVVCLHACVYISNLYVRRPALCVAHVHVCIFKLVALIRVCGKTKLHH